jgi:hypothetical protein
VAAKREVNVKGKRAKLRKAEALRRRRELRDALLKVLKGS